MTRSNDIATNARAMSSNRQYLPTDGRAWSSHGTRPQSHRRRVLVVLEFLSKRDNHYVLAQEVAAFLHKSSLMYAGGMVDFSW